MTSDKLPSVLFTPNNNSLSMERALKQIQQLLLDLAPEGPLSDRVAASIDDLDTMLAAINRD